MAYNKPYKCTNCGEIIPREQVTVVRVQFMPPGSGAKVIKSRTINWLCPPCRDADPVWNLASHDAPAYQM